VSFHFKQASINVAHIDSKHGISNYLVSWLDFHGFRKPPVDDYESSSKVKVL